ncbi:MULTISPECIES: PepSY-associated TM helix domain-containing protein [Bradyrhizobium]|jgi:uncharacterized iron-regulated membrane protein|uniref:PepSY-associated TM helix domain-containing protein n=1 Tax=Bradyrhizobium TaxID=374 RepID=UPI00041B9578|nr:MULTISPECIES: PepSY-associated TM helix domain-containing protein [Bradyrhizobium]KIU44674.1 peptidase [Bradyrhizobium elkanii]MBK5653727.1 PepSY domain-containing protein [Rhizobium sp.]OCX26407.1 peptidase [Bradyrhizobium sp. UASWS1016]
MEPTFRQSMNWLHTWAGVVVGGLLFAIFWMGTLSVFDKEIDRWMAPSTRLAMPSGTLSLDAQRSTYRDAVADRAATWNVFLPNDRLPVARTAWFGARGIQSHYHDPADGHELGDPGTLAASGFLYPFHYHLHLRFMNLGLWLVGAASMAMLALCVSGVIIHRRIFADFFTFRPERRPRRAILDLHNIAGVLGLPFHFVITLSGLVIFYNLYFMSGWVSAYGVTNLRTFNQGAFSSFARPKANRPGELASLDAMAEQVRRLWPGSELASLTVFNPGDAAAYVQLNVSNADRITSAASTAFFDGATGRLLFQRSELAPVMTSFRFLFGLHVIQFQNWALRWIYFVLGVAGCVLILTGFLFWLESRRKRHVSLGLHGVRVVEALAVGGTSGIIAATLAFFVANRALPANLADKAALEVWVFYLAWLATFVHAGVRPGVRAWREQAGAIGVLAIVAVTLNAVTTGDHLLRSLTQPYLWPVAGMDILLLLCAAIAAVTAWRLRAAARLTPLAVEGTAEHA